MALTTAAASRVHECERSATVPAMTIPRSVLVALGAAVLAVVGVAQEPAVMTKGAPAAIAPVVSMRHVGARMRPAAAMPKAAVPASFRKAEPMRLLPVHFRH